MAGFRIHWRLVLGIVAALTVLSALATVLIDRQQSAYLEADERNHVDRVVHLISHATREHLNRRDYAGAVLFLEGLTKRFDDIAGLEATTRDGTRLVAFERKPQARRTSDRTFRIPFSRDNHLVIRIVFDQGRHERVMGALNTTLISVFGLFILVLGAVLWFVVAKFGLAPLRAEEARKRAEILEATAASLKESHDQLERSNTALERFAYVASHDLREPLRTITIYLQLLERRVGDGLDKDGRDYIDFVVRAAGRMNDLIADLLAYSRVSAKAEPFTRQETEKVAQVALEQLAHSVQESGAVIKLGTLPAVSGDGVQLMQVFQNLIGNALKFRHPDRPPEVVVGAEARDGEWEFSVTDNGIGIPAGEADKLFAIFTRLHTHEAYPGTGIGLATCKTIVERHGGRIWVESEEGKGTTFRFTLPRESAFEGEKAA